MSKEKIKLRGFTLVELIITLSIAAILAAIAAPSFASIIQNNRMATQYNELLASLTLARSEAIKRGQRVSVCQSSTGNSCGGSATNWHAGWLVFVDTDSDDNRDVGEEILRVNASLSGGNTLAFGTTRTRVAYASDGLAVGNSNGTFTLCDARGDASSRGLLVSTTGRARHAVPADGLNACP